MRDFDYDLFVIGGGSGGVRAARVAASGGANVALAEEFRMGGTCVIRGCVPKKLMVFASEFGAAAADARAYGWADHQAGRFDWSGHFLPMLTQELARLEGIYTRNLANSGAEIFNARVVVTGAHEVELSTGERFTAKHILVATGGRPFVPEVPGAREFAITSNEVFSLEALPRRVLIVGGGYIASEFACIYQGLGVETAQWYRGDQILRGFDREVRDLLGDAMTGQGIDLQLGRDVVSIERGDDGFIVTGNDGERYEFDQVVYATGRVPNTAGLGLEAVGVELGRSGEVVVDAYSQTSVPSIFAIGDVTNRITLTPVAIREAMAFVDTVFNAKPTKADHENVASAVFTQPQYGTVGLSEDDARALEKIDVYSAKFRPMQNSFIGKDAPVLFKLIVSQATQKVMGVHIVADGAGEMIQFVGVLIKMGATKADFDAAVAVHPTMSEEIVLMKTPTRSDET